MGSTHSLFMERQTFQARSPSELRDMAQHTDDPVIREALDRLADFVERESQPEEKGNPWVAKH